VSRNGPVLARLVVIIAADICGFVLLQHAARLAETWLSGGLAGLVGPGRINVVQGTSILVVPWHQPRFLVAITASCSSIFSVCAIASLACVLPHVPLARRALALSVAVGAVVAANVVRLAVCLIVGLAFGRVALVLFHAGVGIVFAFAYTLVGFVLFLYLILPNRRACVSEAVPVA